MSNRTTIILLVLLSLLAALVFIDKARATSPEICDEPENPHILPETWNEMKSEIFWECGYQNRTTEWLCYVLYLTPTPYREVRRVEYHGWRQWGGEHVKLLVVYNFGQHTGWWQAFDGSCFALGESGVVHYNKPLDNIPLFRYIPPSSSVFVPNIGSTGPAVLSAYPAPTEVTE